MATSKVESSGSNRANNATNGENSATVGPSSESDSAALPIKTGISYASIVVRKKAENGISIPNNEVGPRNKSQQENGLSQSASVAVETDPKMTNGASMDQSTMNLKKRDEQEKVQKASRGKSNVNNSKGYNGNANGRESHNHHNYRSHNYHYEGGGNSNHYNEHRNGSRYPAGKHENHHNHTHQKMTNYSRENQIQQNNHHFHSQKDEFQEPEQNDADEGAFQTVVRKKSRNVGNTDSGKDKEFITNNNRNGRGGRNFRNHNRKVQPEGKDKSRRQMGERDIDKHPTVPSHQQPQTPTSQSPINNSSRSSSAIVNGNGSSSCANGLSVVSGKATVVNDSAISVCSETSSSSLDPVESNTNNSPVNISGSLDGTEVDPHPNNSHGMVVAHNRYLSGGSESISASTCETENNLNSDIAQSLEEGSSKLQLEVVVDAPPPAVNPWQKHPNAASVIAKIISVPQAVAQPPVVKAAGTTIPPTSVLSRSPQQISQKQPVPALNGELKGIQKEKTNNTKAINSKNICTVTTNTTLNTTQTQQVVGGSVKSPTQCVEQSSSPTVKPVQSTPPKKSADPQLPQHPQPSQHKDIKLPQEQGARPRRAFAAVTKSQKIGLGRDRESKTPTLQQDWPTLEEASSTPLGTPSVAHSKSVIAMAHEPKKLTRSNTSGTESTPTDSGDDMTLIDEISPKKLSSDKWPSIASPTEPASTTEDAKNSRENNNNILHSNLEGAKDVASSCISTGEAGEVDLAKAEQKSNGEGQRVNENGHTSSSDDSTDAVENELDSEAVSGQNRNSKKSKRTWRHLDLHSPSSKSRGRRDRVSIDREQRDKDNNIKEPSNHKVKAKILSHKEDGHVNVEGKSNNNYIGRGRGRANVGRGGRGGRGRMNNGGHHQQHWNYQDVADPAVVNSPAEEYTDYPRQYTTLHPMYPVTEFVMPYICSGSPPPGVGVLIDTTKINPVYVTPNEQEVLSFLQHQIEYYFSAQNLEKDEYMKTIMDEQGYIPVEKIAVFNRISVHAKGRMDKVIQAIQASRHLELSDDSTCVRTAYEPTKWPKPAGQALGYPPARIPTTLQSQIEKLFTQEHLAKDLYMRTKIDEEGYFPVNVLAHINTVRIYTEEVDKVILAIKASPHLELSEDSNGVRPIYEPTKWRTLPIHPSPIVGHNNPQPEPSVASSASISNGMESLSVRSTPPVQSQAPIVSDKVRMNPDAPQFVPKSQIPETGG